jgi:hypothetical protein
VHRDFGQGCIGDSQHFSRHFNADLVHELRKDPAFFGQPPLQRANADAGELGRSMDRQPTAATVGFDQLP